MHDAAPRIHKPLYFIMVSVLSGGVYYLVLAAASGFSHPFLNLFLFPFFMALLFIIAGVVYALSFRGIPDGDKDAHRAGVRKTAVIVIAALILSAIFPAAALVRVYPVPMAWLVFFWREQERPPLLYEAVLASAAVLSLVLSYTAMYIYGLLLNG